MDSDRKQMVVLARTDAECQETSYGERPSASCPEGIARVRTVDAWTDSSGRFLVAMRLGDTPVLIPNTMVKT